MQCELTNEFLLEKFDCKNTEDFNRYVYKILDDKLNNEIITKTRNDTFMQIINASTFNLDSKQVTEYALEIVNGYRNIASLKNMELTEYWEKELKLTENEFYERCYNEAAAYVKEYLIVGAIARERSIRLEEWDIDDYLKKQL